MTEQPQRERDLDLSDWEFFVSEDDVVRFADAVRYRRDALRDGLPPTFPVVASAERVSQFLYGVLKLNRRRVVHGGQSYRYFSRLQLGDMLRCSLRLVSDEVKVNRRGEALRILVREVHMRRQPEDKLVVVERSTTIERQTG